MSWMDRVLGRKQPRRPPDPTASGAEPTDDPKLSSLREWEAMRLAREAEAESRWAGQKGAARIIGKGAAAFRLAPDLPETFPAYAHSLHESGQTEQLVAFAGENWTRIVGGSRRELLRLWLEGTLCSAKDDSTLQQAVEWAEDPARTGPERSLGLAVLGRALAERRPGFHPLTLFPAILESAAWDAEAIELAAIPDLTKIEELSATDRAYLWYHVFRVTGNLQVGGLLASLAAATGATDESVAVRRAISDADGGNVEHLSFAAETLVAAGRYEEAIADAASASLVKPESIYPLYLRVHALRLLGREEEAAALIEAMRAQYRRLRRESGDLADNRQLLDNLLWFFGNFAPDETEQTSLAREAHRLGLPDGKIQGARGAYLYRTGRWEEAVAHLRRALDAEPTQSEPAALLARALLKLGRPEEARRVLAGCLEAAPANLHRAELEALLREAGGHPPPLPVHFGQTRSFLATQSWTFLRMVRGVGADLSLRISDISCDLGPEAGPRASVKIQNNGTSPIPLSPRGLLAGQLYLYGYGQVSKGRTYFFLDLTRRGLGDLVTIEPGGEAEVTLDLEGDVQGQLFFRDARVRHASGWLVAAVVPERKLKAFDAWLMPKMTAIVAGRETAQPLEADLDPSLSGRIALSAPVSFSCPQPGDLPEVTAGIEAGLSSKSVEEVYRTLRLVGPLLAVDDAAVITPAVKQRIEARLAALAADPEPIIRASAVLAAADTELDVRHRLLEAAAEDAHWYVRLSALLSPGTDQGIPRSSWIRRLERDPDDLVRTIASRLSHSTPARP